MKLFKSILIISTIIVLLYSTTAFIISDPHADYIKRDIQVGDEFHLSEIHTNNSTRGAFKAAVKFKYSNSNDSNRAYFGQVLEICDNNLVDRIFIGITDNNISRVEIWNDKALIDTKEFGFVGKMTWGEEQTMEIEFLDHTNKRYAGQSEISMRFYSGTGFLGDIATITFDLSEYGSFNADKSIGVFAKGFDYNEIVMPEFSNLRIWKNHKSFD